MNRLAHPAPAPAECTEADTDAWGTGQLKSCCDGLEQCNEPRPTSSPFYNQYPTIVMCRRDDCDGGDAPVAEPAPTPRPTTRPTSRPTSRPTTTTAKPIADDGDSSGGEGFCCFYGGCGQCQSVAESPNWCVKGRKECVQDCGQPWCDGGDAPPSDTCDLDVYAAEGEDVYDSQGVERECCPGLEAKLEDRDASDPLFEYYPKVIVCRPTARRNLRGNAN